MNSSTTSKIISYDDRASVEEVKDIYNKKYNLDLKTTEKYCPFDMIDKDKKIVIEVKHRTCSSTTYATSIMPNNKFIEGRDYIRRGYTVLFVVKFKDGIFEYRYNMEDLHTIRDIENHQNGRQYVFIYMKKFKKL